MCLGLNFRIVGREKRRGKKAEEPCFRHERVETSGGDWNIPKGMNNGGMVGAQLALKVWSEQPG